MHQLMFQSGFIAVFGRTGGHGWSSACLFCCLSVIYNSIINHEYAAFPVSVQTNRYCLVRAPGQV